MSVLNTAQSIKVQHKNGSEITFMTTNIPSQADICIIGAGPAGATTSMFLSKAGIPHLLIDKDEFPRDKICGDGIDANSIRVLNQFNPQLIAELHADWQHFTPIRGIKLTAPNGKSSEALHRPTPKSAPEPMYFTCKRQYFDTFLHRQLNPEFANIQLGTQVTNLERQDGGINVTMTKNGATHTTFARLVIGADGDHSVVLRKLDERKIDRNFYAAALRMYCRNVSDMHPENLLEVYFPKKVNLGYFWIFPLPNGEMNVGFGMSSQEVSIKKINLRHVFEDIIHSDPFFAHRFRNADFLETPQGWGLPLAARERKNVGDHFLLAGDAGSLVQPLNGEGIGSAMISGLIAAQFAQKAVEHQRFDAGFLQKYQTESSKRMSKEIRSYKQILNLPSSSGQLKNIFLNTLIATGAAKYAFERGARQWVNTAMHKPILVDL